MRMGNLSLTKLSNPIFRELPPIALTSAFTRLVRCSKKESIKSIMKATY